eukprot:GFUD01007015.1.p1 GENE.GFUD01007015.1~~GFUD01007015.1.p1  ORF type:complete len:749 (+),score=231.55 GFUD01007015.1:274-2247(+)
MAKHRSTPTASLNSAKGVKANNALHQNVVGGKSRSLQHSPKVRQQLNGVKNASKPQLVNHKVSSPGSINTAYSKLQKNGAISVEPVKGAQNRINGVRPIQNKKVVKEVPKHFVDFMLKDADDCIEQFVNMVGEVKKMWKLSRRKEGDVTAVTKKLRKILDLAKHNIGEVDKKVVDSYRTNLEDADVRDISPEDVASEKNKERELEIFAKSKDIGNNDVENVESTPDLPFMDFQPSGSGSDTGEIVIDESSEEPESIGNGETDSDTQVVDLESEEGIHDMSVEELEVDEESEKEYDSEVPNKTDIKSDELSNSSENCEVRNDTPVVMESVTVVKERSDTTNVDGSKIIPNGIKDEIDVKDDSTKVETKKEIKELSKDDSEENSKEDTVKVEGIGNTEDIKVEDIKNKVEGVEKDENIVKEKIKIEKDVKERDIKIAKDENIVKEAKTEKEVKEKDIKVTIEYRNEASPIKDQKDIIKESIRSKTNGGNNGNSAQNEIASTEAVINGKELVNKEENIKKSNSEKEKLESVSELVETKVVSLHGKEKGSHEEVVINDNSNGEDTEDEKSTKETDAKLVKETEESKNPGDSLVEAILSETINALDSDNACEVEQTAETKASETCIEGPQDSKSNDSCHTTSEFVQPSEETVRHSGSSESRT